MTTTADRLLSALTRREVLAAGGVAAAIAAAPPAFGNPPGEEHFGRLFPSLPPFAAPSAKLTAAMLELGAPGGPLDAKDELGAGAAQLILDPALSLNNPNNPTHTAGVTFFGQFIDHDLTFDLTSRLGRPTKPRTSPNSRSPAFDLDSVYGAGPEEIRVLRDCEGCRARPATPAQDRPWRPVRGPAARTKTLQAIIPDPRNDENLIVGGLHAAFSVSQPAGRLPEGGGRHPGAPVPSRPAPGALALPVADGARVPAAARRAGVVDDILEDRPAVLSASRAPFIPVEFQRAAIAFGHCMVRPSYRANLAGDAGNRPSSP